MLYNHVKKVTQEEKTSKENESTTTNLGLDHCGRFCQIHTAAAVVVAGLRILFIFLL